MQRGHVCVPTFVHPNQNAVRNAYPVNQRCQESRIQSGCDRGRSALDFGGRWLVVYHRGGYLIPRRTGYVFAILVKTQMIQTPETRTLTHRISF